MMSKIMFSRIHKAHLHLFRFVISSQKNLLINISAATGATSPTWVSDMGLRFTSANQFFQIPGFIPKSDGLMFEVSFAFTFYIKIDAVPTTPATIFSYYSAIVNLFFST